MYIRQLSFLLIAATIGIAASLSSGAPACGSIDPIGPSFLVRTNFADGVDPFAFFRPSVVVRDRDRAAVDRGTPFASVVDSSGHEVAVFSAVAVERQVDADRLIAWIRNIEVFKQSKYVLALKRFSSPPRLDDVAALSLEEGDLNDVKKCRPGKCDLKLSAAEIGDLQRAIRSAGDGWKSAVQTAFRQIVLRRVQLYSDKGHAGLANFSDRDGSSTLESSFQGLVVHSPFLGEHAARLAEYLTRYPAVSLPDLESFFYWSSEKLGNKPVVSATHVVILRGQPGGPDVLVASKQIFATHYVDGSLGITALVADESMNRRYLAYLNRSNLDVLGGFWGGLVRMVIERRLKSEAPGVLRQLHDRLTSGPPPYGAGRS
jgi:hypothetical protein